MTSAHGSKNGVPGLSFQSCALESREGLVKSEAVLAREGLWMLACDGLDEKQAPGDETQAPDANARLKARSRSLLLWSADRPRCTSASLRCASEAALEARRRTGKACGSGDEGGEAPESGPPSLESENLSPKRRPPPIVDAAFTIVDEAKQFRAVGGGGQKYMLHLTCTCTCYSHRSTCISKYDARVHDGRKMIELYWNATRSRGFRVHANAHATSHAHVHVHVHAEWHVVVHVHDDCY